MKLFGAPLGRLASHFENLWFREHLAFVSLILKHAVNKFLHIFFQYFIWHIKYFKLKYILNTLCIGNQILITPIYSVKDLKLLE